MTEQKKRILSSVNYIRGKKSFKKKCEIAIISYRNPAFMKKMEILESIPFTDIPPAFEGGLNVNKGEFLLIKNGNSKKNIIFLNGRFNFHDGYNMRDAAHPVYVLHELGVRTIILIDEVGYLNPRFNVGGIALIYDHINLMGYNPLIGENDESLGPRFPDMSNAYDSDCHDVIEKDFIDARLKFYPSVYLGIPGPETETEAECRFYREIGADVLGYGIIPENLAAVHSGMKVVGLGMISRELVADRLSEVSEEVQRINRVKAEKAFTSMLQRILNSL